MQPQPAQASYYFAQPNKSRQAVQLTSRIFNMTVQQTAQELSGQSFSFSNSKQNNSQLGAQLTQQLVTHNFPLQLEQVDIEDLELKTNSSSAALNENLQTLSQHNPNIYDQRPKFSLNFEDFSLLQYKSFKTHKIAGASKKLSQVLDSKTPICRERAYFLAHQGPIWAMQLSSDVQFLITGGRDQTVRLWHVARAAAKSPIVNGQLQCAIASPPAKEYIGHNGDILCLSFSSSNYIISGGQDCCLRRWHPIKDYQLGCMQFDAPVIACSFVEKSDDLIVCALANKFIILIDLASGSQKKVNVGDLIVQIVCAHGKLFLGSSQGFLQVRDQKTLKLLQQLSIQSTSGKLAKPQPILSLQLSDSRNEILVTSADSRIRMYSTKSYVQLMKFKGHENSQEQQFNSTFLSTDYIEYAKIIHHEPSACRKFVAEIATIGSDAKLSLFDNAFVSLDNEQSGIYQSKSGYEGHINVQKCASVQLPGKLTQMRSFSVQKEQQVGDKAGFVWVLFISDMDGYLRVLDFQ